MRFETQEIGFSYQSICYLPRGPRERFQGGEGRGREGKGRGVSQL